MLFVLIKLYSVLEKKTGIKKQNKNKLSFKSWKTDMDIFYSTKNKYETINLKRIKSLDVIEKNKQQQKNIYLQNLESRF